LRVVVRVVAWLLLAGWASTVALTFWTLPRESTPQQLRADIAAGRVAHYAQVYGLVHQPGPWHVTTTDFSASSAAPGIAWSLHDGRRRWASITGVPVDLGSPAPQNLTPLNPDGTAGPPVVQPATAPFIAALDRSGATRGLPSDELLQVAVTVITVMSLVMLLAGPPPQRGTKWFWFWLWQTPLGLGFAGWLVLEHVWPPRQPVARRQRGLLGFILGQAASFVLSFVL
jgi:hypothetical protein